METHTRHERRARGSGHASDRVTRTSLTPSADAPGPSVKSLTVPPRSIAPASGLVKPSRDPYRESHPKTDPRTITRSTRGTAICRCLDQRPVSGPIPHAAGFDSRGSHHLATPLQAAGIAIGEEIGASAASPTGMTGKGGPAGSHPVLAQAGILERASDCRRLDRQRGGPDAKFGTRENHRPRRTAAEVSGESPSDLVCPSPGGPSAYEEAVHA